ncbi:hypothetical protein FSARC_11921 [Fusarium sarcochroum]|uniref:TM2 domain-containing protein n=1 Tax=Fusarium sarcochroum TaxID=1208366 RepID=A0A8H4WZA5_9HYPO|nr:hypothetical protein FSARC_11921 [Fusarium sarcochroum]
MHSRNVFFAEKLGRGVTHGMSHMIHRWRLFILAYIFVAISGGVLLYLHNEKEMAHLVARGWGGFDERPLTDKCYGQERKAMLLSLFFGCLGIDQYYAHHWPLAIFKILTFGGLGLWAMIDMILWIVGGVYGTPGCPGGSSRGWQY